MQRQLQQLERILPFAIKQLTMRQALLRPVSQVEIVLLNLKESDQQRGQFPQIFQLPGY
jgi:hypothetical protein